MNKNMTFRMTDKYTYFLDGAGGRSEISKGTVEMNEGFFCSIQELSADIKLGRT